MSSKLVRRAVTAALSAAITLGSLVLSSTPASAAAVKQRVAIGNWHCSAGGSVISILGFSNFPNGWTFYGTLPGNTISASAWTGRNYAYGTVQCKVNNWLGSKVYNQEITSPMYYWADGSGTKQL